MFRLYNVSRRWVSLSSLFKSRKGYPTTADEILRCTERPAVAELYVAWADKTKIIDQSINVIMDYGYLLLEKGEEQGTILRGMFDAYRFAQEDLIVVPERAGVVLLRSCLLVDRSDVALLEAAYKSAWTLYSEIVQEKVLNPNTLRYSQELAETMMLMASHGGKTEAVRLIRSHAKTIGITIHGESLNPVSRYSLLSSGGKHGLQLKKQHPLRMLGELLPRTDLPKPIKSEAIKNLVDDLSHSDSIAIPRSYAAWMITMFEEAGIQTVKQFAESCSRSKGAYEKAKRGLLGITFLLEAIEGNGRNKPNHRNRRIRAKKAKESIISALKQSGYSHEAHMLVLRLIPDDLPQLFEILHNYRGHQKSAAFAAEYLTRVIHRTDDVKNACVEFNSRFLSDQSIIRWLSVPSDRRFVPIAETVDWEYLQPPLFLKVYELCKDDSGMILEFAKHFIENAAYPMPDTVLVSLLPAVKGDLVLASDLFRKQQSLGICPSVECHALMKEMMERDWCDKYLTDNVLAYSAVETDNNPQQLSVSSS
eukprot:TRINITY_DN4576_c0_g1_i1.p1 TRINITY_DN4576_c0_g1~~TRINITY_DN4576_c0_g1_i1.p1  ORF type:complete len:535 (+),score=65.06 TRINITY_DN4576_c0_g1_i1:52-1656(+)